MYTCDYIYIHFYILYNASKKEENLGRVIDIFSRQNLASNQRNTKKKDTQKNQTATAVFVIARRWISIIIIL